MTQEKKQITIYDLLPLLKPGWVAADEDGVWTWFEYKPRISSYGNFWSMTDDNQDNNYMFHINIAPFDGDWEDSLMECGK